MKQILRNFTKSCDLYPRNFSFYIKGKDNKRTVWGGIFSLLLIIVTIIMTLYNFVSFRFDKRPIVLVTEEFIGDQKAITIPPENTHLMKTFLDTEKGIQIQTIPLIQSSLASGYVKVVNTAAVTNNSLETNTNQTSPENSFVGKFSSCSPNLTEFPGMIKTETGMLLSKFSPLSFCNHYNNGSKVYLGGDPVATQEKTFLQFSAVYDICGMSNKIIARNCRNQTALNQIKNTLVITYGNYIQNMTERTGSMQFFMTKDVIFLMNLDLKVEITVKKNVVYSDNNVIYDFYPPEEFIFYSLADIKYSYVARSEVNMLAMVFDFTLSNFQNVYQRSYTKLDQVLASTLSVYSIFALICEVLVNIFEHGSLEYYLMKRLYYFNSGENDFQFIFGVKEKLRRNKTKKQNQTELKLKENFDSSIRNINSDKESKKNGNNALDFYKDKEKDWSRIIRGDKFERNKFKLILLHYLPCLCKKSSIYFWDVRIIIMVLKCCIMILTS